MDTYEHTAPVLADVLDERQRQHEKFGDQISLPPGAKLAILGEEYGEVCEEVVAWYASMGDWLANKSENEDVAASVARLRTELVQLAAVAVQWVEHIDRDDRLTKRGQS